MRVFNWLLAGLVGWSAIGTVVALLAFSLGDRRGALRSFGWIAGAWAIYLAALFTVSARQQGKIIPAGQEECFGKMCFSVAGVSASPEFKGEGGGRLVQVSVQVRNTGDEIARVDDLRAYLVDAGGDRWSQTVGLGGVPLTVRLPGSATTRSVPVFRVEGDPGRLGLVLTRGHSGLGWLVIGDTDSPGHARTVLNLP